MITIQLTEEERKVLEKCLIVDIDRWEDRLERRRGMNTEGVIADRIDTMRLILEKIQ